MEKVRLRKELIKYLENLKKLKQLNVSTRTEKSNRFRDMTICKSKIIKLEEKLKNEKGRF